MREGVPQLLAQAGDEHVDRVAHRILALAPGLLEDLLPRDDGARGPHQRLEDHELARGQLQRRFAAPRRSLRGIEPQVAAGQLRRRAALVATHQGMGAGGEDVEVEGLADVVVGAVREPFHRRLRIVHRRQHQDRTAEPVPSSAAADLQAVAVRKSPVQDQQIVFVEGEELLGVLDAARRVGCEARPSEGSEHQVPQAPVVLENRVLSTLIRRP